MKSIGKALVLGAIALAAGLVVPQPARAQLGRPKPIGSLLALGGPQLASFSVTPLATSGPGGTSLGRPPASPITPPGPTINN